MAGSKVERNLIDNTFPLDEDVLSKPLRDTEKIFFVIITKTKQSMWI